MITLNNISPSDNIGNSLYFINQNFEIIDAYLTDFNRAASNIRGSVIDSSYIDSLKSLNSSDLESITSSLSSIVNFVESNKLNWIKPFSVFYPEFFSSKTDISTEKIATWLNKNYPFLDLDGINNFSPDHQAIVYCFVNSSTQVLKEQISLKDSTTCDASSVTYCGQCILEYYNTSNDINDIDFPCSDFSTTCTECKEADCYYTGLPYTNSSDAKEKIVEGSIQANLNLNFTNTQEDEIIAMRFVINPYNIWEFSSNLT